MKTLSNGDWDPIDTPLFPGVPGDSSRDLFGIVKT